MSSTNAENQPNNAFELFCAAYRLDMSAVWLVACSGGCDSSALAHMVYRAVNRAGGTVRLAYLDHGLRSSAERIVERSAVEALAEQLGGELLLEHLQPGQLQQEAVARGIGIEAAAREARYGFLDRIAYLTQARYVATGHHADDHAETVIMRLLRASGPTGLSGIPALRTVCNGEGAIRYAIVRPLIGVTHALLRAFCLRNQIRWVEDRSNVGQDYQRNLVRNTIMPHLLSFEPKAARNIARAAAKIRESQDALAQLARELVVWSVEPNGLSTEAPAFMRWPSALRRVALYQALEIMRGSDRIAAGVVGSDRIPAHFLEPLVCRNDAKDGSEAAATVLRGHGLNISLATDRLYLAADVVRCNKKGYLVACRQQSAGMADFSVEVKNVACAGVASETTILHGADLLPPVLVRSRRPGDSIRLRFGRKSLKKLFNELGVPRYERSGVAVVEDRAGIAAVLLPSEKAGNLFRVGIEPLDKPVGAVTRCEWKGDRVFEEFA